MRIVQIGLMAALVLAGCAAPTWDASPTETVLPMGRAWVDGQTVDYVTTDISDLAMARAAGINYVPRLALAAKHPPGSSVLERVYKFPDGEQISVFQSAPNPVGADNQDRGYSPLWRMVLVRWSPQVKPHELKSEEAILAAEEKGEVALEVTEIVVNCPVTRNAKGQALKGVR